MQGHVGFVLQHHNGFDALHSDLKINTLDGFHALHADVGYEVEYNCDNQYIYAMYFASNQCELWY